MFVATETRARQPITPLRLFADVSRAGSFIARLLLIAGIDTTWSAIGSALWHLAKTPADR